jgi:hypothetical protein
MIYMYIYINIGVGKLSERSYFVVCVCVGGGGVIQGTKFIVLYFLLMFMASVQYNASIGCERFAIAGQYTEKQPSDMQLFS